MRLVKIHSTNPEDETLASRLCVSRSTAYRIARESLGIARFGRLVRVDADRIDGLIRRAFEPDYRKEKEAASRQQVINNVRRLAVAWRRG